MRGRLAGVVRPEHRQPSARRRRRYRRLRRRGQALPLRGRRRVLARRRGTACPEITCVAIGGPRADRARRLRVRGRVEGVLPAAFTRRQGVARARAALALLRRRADDRVPDRSRSRRRAPPGRRRARRRGSRSRRDHLGRLAVVQRLGRGAARPRPLPVQGMLRRRPLPVRGRDVLALRLHLGRQGLRARAGLVPGLSEEARVDLDDASGVRRARRASARRRRGLRRDRSRRTTGASPRPASRSPASPRRGAS